MKIRNGFVSNSSSSSFCIYGTCMYLYEILEKMKNSLTENELKDLEKEGDYYIEEILSNKIKNMEIHQCEGTFWIGKSWTQIDDNQTGGQFKEEIRLTLEKVIGPDIDCDTYEEEIYN